MYVHRMVQKTFTTFQLCSLVNILPWVTLLPLLGTATGDIAIIANKWLFVVSSLTLSYNSTPDYFSWSSFGANTDGAVLLVMETTTWGLSISWQITEESLEILKNHGNILKRTIYYISRKKSNCKRKSRTKRRYERASSRRSQGAEPRDHRPGERRLNEATQAL